MTAKSLRRRLWHLFKHAPATSAISPAPRKILKWREEKPYYQHLHNPNSRAGGGSRQSTHIHTIKQRTITLLGDEGAVLTGFLWTFSVHLLHFARVILSDYGVSRPPGDGGSTLPVPV